MTHIERIESTGARQAVSAYSSFFNSSLDHHLSESLSADPVKTALSLFRNVATTVPAYQQFLSENNLSPESVQTFDQFQALPLITKDNYIKRYPLKDRCRDKGLKRCDMVAASSGSTGSPTLWPRSFTDELQVATRFEQIFYDSFEADKKSTLAVVCFALGNWVGGMYTTNCCRYLAQKGYSITTVTPGNNKAEILRIVRALGKEYEQTVLLGYPPFLKDVIDTGIAEGMQWLQYQVKLVMAGEVFSEEWRNLVCDRLGAQHPHRDSASLYGTADAGVLGNETPLSIQIRRFLSATPKAARNLFGESRLPTLVQYDPTSRFFETEDKQLIFSGDGGVPLLRYNIRDTGGIIAYPQMLEFLSSYGYDPTTEFESYDNPEVKRGLRPFPFVYVFGRSDFTVSYFGANIYPENVTVGLEQPEIQGWVTGKFVMQVIEDADKNRFLSIVVELAPGESKSKEREEQITESVLVQLLRLNSEFASYVPSTYQRPCVTLVETGNSEYFPAGVKHRYTRRAQQ